MLRKDNRRHLQSRGIVVFLDTTLDTQVRRTEKDRRRPMLQNTNRRQVLSELKDVRDPIYMEVADFRIFVGDSNSKKTVSEIIHRLKNGGLLQE